MGTERVERTYSTTSEYNYSNGEYEASNDGIGEELTSLISGSAKKFIQSGAKIANEILSSSIAYDMPISETCMDIALSNPSSTKTKEYKTVNPKRVKTLLGDSYDKLKKNYPTAFNNPYPTIEFSAESEIAKEINNSKSIKEMAKAYSKLPNNKKVIVGTGSMERNTDSTDLYAAIHKYRIVNPKIENGYFTGYLYDTYDFDEIKDGGGAFKYFNNTAVKLQNKGIIKNYNLLVPIKVKM